MQIEAGKFYRDAAGAKRGPLAYADANFWWEEGHSKGIDPEWSRDGGALLGGIDLVALWEDEPVAAPAATTLAKTLRDEFAEGCSVEGIVFPDIDTLAEFVGETAPDADDFIGQLRLAKLGEARIRYVYADAMMAAREVRS